jgi:hypothetical protein
VDHKSTFATNRQDDKGGAPVEVTVECYVVPEKYRTFRQFSSAFRLGRTIEQFYGEWSDTPGHALNYS